MSLAELRASIDAVDDQLLALLGRRLELATEIARHKRRQSLPARDPARETEMLERARAQAQSPLTPDSAARLLRACIDATHVPARLMSARKSATRRIAIIGLGLVGSSLARALKHSNPEHAIRGVDLEPVQALARQSGLFAEVLGASEVARAVWDAEVVFLCAPGTINLSHLAAVRASVPEDAVVTDTGGLKLGICEAAAALFDPVQGPWFVGGHPLAGSHTSGFVSGSEMLFVDRPWVLTPHQRHSVSPLKRVQGLIESIGARLVLMTPEEHDRTIVPVSHLPQLLAIALALCAGGRERGVAGPAFTEMTRLSQSPAALWTELLHGASVQVTMELQRLRSYLSDLEMAVSFKEPMEPWFARAAALHTRLIQES